MVGIQSIFSAQDKILTGKTPIGMYLTQMGILKCHHRLGIQKPQRVTIGT